MPKILKSPGKYVQGDRILENFGKYTKGIGNHFLVIISSNGMQRIGQTLQKSVAGSELKLDFAIFSGECTRSKIEMYAKQCVDQGITAIVGVGGYRKGCGSLCGHLNGDHSNRVLDGFPLFFSQRDVR